VNDGQIGGPEVGLRCKSTRGRGGVVKNIFIENINMLDISGDALLFDLYYFTKNAPKEIPPVDETTPQFKDITITGVTSFNSGKSLKFNGIPEMKIENVSVSNSVFTATDGALLSESKDVKLKNVSIRANKGPALTINNVENAEITGCQLISNDKEPVLYTGDNLNVKVEK
ncbi:MAG: glycoside hydrolase family 28 protein, partial [Duncaniella sp.]|nr:glycoside hydrolase family 28 protein [Duncaniella sp.]